MERSGDERSDGREQDETAEATSGLFSLSSPALTSVPRWEYVLLGLEGWGCLLMARCYLSSVSLSLSRFPLARSRRSPNNPVEMVCWTSLLEPYLLSIGLSIFSSLVPLGLSPLYGQALSTSPYTPPFAFLLALLSPFLSSPQLATLAFGFSCATTRLWIDKVVGPLSGTLGVWVGPLVGWVGAGGWGCVALCSTGLVRASLSLSLSCDTGSSSRSSLSRKDRAEGARKALSEASAVGMLTPLARS